MMRIDWDNSGTRIEWNPDLARATRVGSSTTFGINETRPTGIASFGGSLYLVGWDNQALYSLNPATGVATRSGTSVSFNSEEAGPMGMASDGGFLYMVGRSRGAIYIITTSTGEGFLISPLLENFGVGEDLPSALAYHNGIMYMIGSRNDWLYTINTSTGIATRVGSITNFGVGGNQPYRYGFT